MSTITRLCDAAMSRRTRIAPMQRAALSRWHGSARLQQIHDALRDCPRFPLIDGGNVRPFAPARGRPRAAH